jgi:predicted RNA-binding protein with PIN domain
VALIVDCYNVLRTTMPPALAGLDEAGLCRALARSAWAGQRITVVCDGAPKPHARDSPVPEVELVYAGRGESADDLIAGLIEADSAPRRLTVVSSDRAIQKAAKRRRAAAMSSEELIHVLASGAGAPGTRYGPSTGGRINRGKPLEAPEVDRWLEEFGFDPEEHRGGG